MFLVGPLVTNQLLTAISASPRRSASSASSRRSSRRRRCTRSRPCRRPPAMGPCGSHVARGQFAFLTWTTLTIGLMLKFNYSWGYGGIGSANVTGGAALALWMRDQSVRGMLSAMFNEFGALYVLAPVGLVLAPRRLRALALVSVPIAAIFCVVQQPDRGVVELSLSRRASWGARARARERAPGVGGHRAVRLRQPQDRRAADVRAGRRGSRSRIDGPRARRGDDPATRSSRRPGRVVIHEARPSRRPLALRCWRRRCLCCTPGAFRMPRFMSRPDEAIIAVDAYALATTGPTCTGVSFRCHLQVQMPGEERTGWFSRQFSTCRSRS